MIQNFLVMSNIVIQQVDPELLKEIEQWNEVLKTDVIKFCQENNFHSGFFDGTENNMVADAYELKVGHKIYMNVIPTSRN
jgi:hypothetical protein